MRLMTKSIEKMAQKQYPKGSDMDQKVVAKFFDPCGSFSWHLMNQDPENPDYCWGIVKGHFVEVGSFNLGDLISYRGAWGLGIERDKFFTPMPAEEVWNKLNEGIHV
jgi:hypothetical protein